METGRNKTLVGLISCEIVPDALHFALNGDEDELHVRLDTEGGRMKGGVETLVLLVNYLDISWKERSRFAANAKNKLQCHSEEAALRATP